MWECHFKDIKKMRVCHKSVTHLFLFFSFSQIRNLKKTFLFTTKPKLSQARALPFRKRFVSLQKTS